MGVADRLRQLDTHSSVSKEFRVYTLQGAILSVVTLLIISYLVVSEIYFNFQVTLEERVHVNATSARGIEMEFDISLHNVPCSKLQIDANDPAGQSQSLHLDAYHHVWKHRFIYKDRENKKGRTLLGEKSKLEMGSTLRNEEDLMGHIEEKFMEMMAKELNVSMSEGGGEEAPVAFEAPKINCGSCYGAGEEGECCNSCEDVKRAYRNRGWRLGDTSGIAQCIEEQKAEQIPEEEGEGCNVHGVVALSSGGGNLHLAPGKESGSLDAALSDVNLLELLIQSFHEWDISHTIHKLRFGPEYPDAVYQLDGLDRSIQDKSGMYQYYFQIVPTRYRYLNGTVIQTNQYSVTEHLRHVSPGSNRGLPGVFFFYEVSPLHVEISQTYRRGWVAFLTSVCAIVGGVVTLMGLLDSYLFRHASARSGSGLAL